MAFKIGDKVKIRQVGGGLKKGIIEVIVTGHQFSMPIVEYGVKLENSSTIEYCLDYDLIEDTDSLSNLRTDCTCGASATYSPHEPPGHAKYCDKDRLDKFWTD